LQIFTIFTYQATPWLEATFRYSIFNPRNLANSSDVLRDRSYEAKARVFRERRLVPEIAIGVRDILGTGVWEGEYFVASKRIGAVDLTAGLGWGRLASRGPFENPLKILDDGFLERPTQAGGSFGGESRSKSYFRGPAAWFGGARYQMSRYPLQLVAEYNSDDYAREVTLNTIKNPSPWNFGIEWRPISNLTVAASWLRNSSFGLRISSATRHKINAETQEEQGLSIAPLSRNPCLGRQRV
jgi:hypothetical protein